MCRFYWISYVGDATVFVAIRHARCIRDAETCGKLDFPTKVGEVQDDRLIYSNDPSFR